MPEREAEASQSRRARLIAFYLPQFHPIPENDMWWGTGFTEWTNVTKAKPLYPGHVQPNLPADLGFYDLRVPEVRRQQADLAAEHGVEAFCYYHYWFAGKLLLQRPLEEVVQTGRPAFSFCVCWANETWTGIWHGAPNRVLVEQTYPGPGDTSAHFGYLERVFGDPRYVRVDGRPLFLIYSPSKLPEPGKTLAQWRALAKAAGLGGLFIVGVGNPKHWNPETDGYDGSTSANLPGLRPWISWRTPSRKVWFTIQKYLKWPTIYSYKEISETLLDRPLPAANHYPVAIPNWDNTPRSRENGRVLHGSTPRLFRSHLRDAVEAVRSRTPDQRLIFLKSWNEWAEGNYVEPDSRWGKAYLAAIKSEIVSG